MIMKLPTRKSPRLKGFDYSTPSAYFVTICTHEKKKILGEILSPIVGEGLCALPKHTLTPIGKEVEVTIHYINHNEAKVAITKYVIMPNHVHLIVELSDAGGDGTPPLQNIIGQIKSYSTKKYGGKLWQRSYHYHIIRDDADYQKIWNYIDTNPLKWEFDCFYK